MKTKQKNPKRENCFLKKYLKVQGILSKNYLNQEKKYMFQKRDGR